MLGHALQEHPSLDEINLKFLEAGHTFMECDTIHSVIEAASRHRTIYVPDDWFHIIKHAKKKEPKYNVQKMNYNDFQDFKKIRNLVRQLSSTNLT